MSLGAARGRKACVAAACFRDAHADIRFCASGGGSLVWTVETDGTIRKRDMTSGRDLGIAWDREGAKARAFLVAGLKLWIGDADGGLRVYDAHPRRVVAESAVHKGPIHCLLHCGAFVYSGSDDGQVCQWDLRTAELVHSFAVNAPALCLAALRTTEINDVLFIGTARSSISFVDITPRGQRPAVQSFGRHTAAVTALAAHRGRLWSGADDCCLKVWNWPATTCVATLVQHTAPISHLTPQGPHVWSASTDGSIAVWNGETFNCLQQFSFEGAPGKRNPAFLTAIAPWVVDCLWVGSGDGVLRVFAAPSHEDPTAATSYPPRVPAASVPEMAQMQQQLQELAAQLRAASAKERRVDDRCLALEEECAKWRRRCAELETHGQRSGDSGASPVPSTVTSTTTAESDLRQQLEGLQSEVDRLRTRDASGGPAATEALRAQLRRADAEAGALRTALHHLQQDAASRPTPSAEHLRRLEAQEQMIQELKAALADRHHRGVSESPMVEELAAANAALRREVDRLRATLRGAAGGGGGGLPSPSKFAAEGGLPDINDIYDKLLRAHEAEVSATDVEQARQEAFKITRDMEGLTDQARLLVTDLIHELAAKDFLLRMQYRDLDALKAHCVDLYRMTRPQSGTRVRLVSTSAEDLTDDLEGTLLNESDTEIPTHLGNVAMDTKRMRLTVRRMVQEMTRGLTSAPTTAEREADDRLVLCHLVFTVLRDTLRKLKDCQKRVKSSEKELEIQDAELNKGEQMVEAVEKLRAEFEAMKIKAKQALEEKARTVELLKLQLQKQRTDALLTGAGAEDGPGAARLGLEREIVRLSLDLLTIQGDHASCTERLSLAELDDGRQPRGEREGLAARLQQLEAARINTQGRLDQAKADAERYGPLPTLTARPQPPLTGDVGRLEALVEDQRRQIVRLIEDLERARAMLSLPKDGPGSLHRLSGTDPEGGRDLLHALDADRASELRALRHELAAAQAQVARLRDQGQDAVVQLELAEMKISSQKGKLERLALEVADLRGHGSSESSAGARGGSLAAELDTLKAERAVLLREREKRLELMKQNAQLEAHVVRLQQQLLRSPS